MAIQLRIRLHGVMPIVTTPDDKHLTGLLVDARSIVKDLKSFVIFPTANFAKTNTRRTFDRAVTPDRLRQHLELANEIITIEARTSAAHATLTIDRSDDPRFVDPTSRDKFSFQWLPQASFVTKTNGDINPDYFDSPDKVTPALLARVHFTQGHARTNGVETIKVPFIDNTGIPQQRSIAREIVIEMDIDDDHFFLRSDSFAGVSNPANDVRFEGSGLMELMIGNESANDMYGGAPAIVPIDLIDADAAKEFEFYSQLSATKATDPLLPHFRSRPGVETGCSHLTYTSTGRAQFTRSAGGAAPLAIASAAKIQKPEWTVFSYIATDNSLRNAGDSDLKRMEAADPTKVSVVAQLDIPEQNTQRFVLTTNGFQSADDSVNANLNSGLPDILTNFLAFGKVQRPSNRAAVFLLSHGNGLRDFIFPPVGASGVSFDRDLFLRDFTSFTRNYDALFSVRAKRMFQNLSVGNDDTARDTLSNTELESAFRDALGAEGPFNIIAMDACLMGMVELAYQLRLCGRYYVAAEDNVVAGGWPYDVILNQVNDRTTPLQFAKTIVDECAKVNAGSLSVVDLAEVSRLVRAMDDLGGALLPALDDDFNAIVAARAPVRSFADPSYVDLGGFVSELQKQFGKGDPVNGAAGLVATCLGNTVVHTATVTGSAPASGLSVYIPIVEQVLPEYKQLAFASDAPRWRAFVEGWVDRL